MVAISPTDVQERPLLTGPAPGVRAVNTAVPSLGRRQLVAAFGGRAFLARSSDRDDHKTTGSDELESNFQ